MHESARTYIHMRFSCLERAYSILYSVPQITRRAEVRERAQRSFGVIGPPKKKDTPE